MVSKSGPNLHQCIPDLGVPVSMPAVMHRAVDAGCLQFLLRVRRGRQRGDVAGVVGPPAGPCRCRNQLRRDPQPCHVDQMVRAPLGARMQFVQVRQRRAGGIEQVPGAAKGAATSASKPPGLPVAVSL